MHKILYTVAQLDYLTIIEEILVQGIKVIASLLKFLFFPLSLVSKIGKSWNSLATSGTPYKQLTTSYQHLTNILPTSYQQLTDNLPTAYQHLTNILPTTYQQLTNCLVSTNRIVEQSIRILSFFYAFCYRSAMSIKIFQLPLPVGACTVHIYTYCKYTHTYNINLIVCAIQSTFC